jgi:O-antigen ligase
MSNAQPTIRKSMALVFLASALAFLPFSILICHIAMSLYVVLWATEGNWKMKVNHVKTNFLLQLLIAWLVVMVAGLFLTENRSAGIAELEKKIFFFLLPVCIATSAVNFSTLQIRSLFYGFTLICFGVIIFCVVSSWIQWNSFDNDPLAFERIDFLNSSNYFASHPDISKSWVFFTYIGLANGIHIHPSYFSLYLAFCIVFLLTEHSQEKTFRYQSAIQIVLIGIFLIALVLLSSRIIVLAMAVIFIGWIVYEFRFHRSWKQTFLIGTLLIGFVVGVFLNPISRHRNWKELTSMSYTVTPQTNYRTSSDIRASLWWLGWRSFQEGNPVWGSGTGDVEDVMKAQGEKYKITNVLGTYDPHNQFLHVLIANGILGLILFSALLLTGFAFAVREKQMVLLVFLILFTLLCITESALELQKGIAFFSLIFSLLTFQRSSSEAAIRSTQNSFAGARN